MRAVSKKRAALLRIYAKVRNDFLAANPNCIRCGHAATEVHHAAGRGAGRLVAVETFRAMCRDCHRWATENPRAAIEQGFSLPRIGRTA